MSKFISRYTSSIISDTDNQDDQSSEILKKFENFGFKNVKLALVKFGKVPEFQYFDEPYTYYNESIIKAFDKNNGIVVPEMVILSPITLKIITSCLLKLDKDFKSTRDLIVCYWYKIPLIGILILNQKPKNLLLT